MNARSAAVLLALALLAPGCGGGGGDQVAATAASQAATATRREAGSTANPSKGRPPQSHATHHDPATGAAQFERDGVDNSIQESGSEASATELRQAAAALHGYLDARAAGAWSRACAAAATALSAQLAQLTTGAVKSHVAPSCPKLLATVSATIPPAARREAAVAQVGALRVEDQSAFILFHGAHGQDYFTPMALEQGLWKVAAIAPSPLS